jgi:hypothetical protein
LEGGRLLGFWWPLKDILRIAYSYEYGVSTILHAKRKFIRGPGDRVQCNLGALDEHYCPQSATDRKSNLIEKLIFNINFLVELDFQAWEKSSPHHFNVL